MKRTPTQQGRYKRRKGAERERELVNLHLAMGVHAERVAPLQAGSSRYGDVDVYPWGEDHGALVCEVKSGTKVPKTIPKYLGDNDALFLRPDRQEWIVVLPWRVWERVCEALK